MDVDSCWAKEPKTLTINSEVSVWVSICSSSNWTETFSSFSSRSTTRQSFVFLAKREMDFTRILSTLPFRQSESSRPNSVRLSIRVPVKPSSA